VGIYSFTKNPTFFSDISTLIGSAPGWRRLSINSPLSVNVLAVNNSCASDSIYAVFSPSVFAVANNTPGLYSSRDSGETWFLILDLQAYNLSSADLRILCGGSSEIILIRSTNAVLRIDTANKQLETQSVTRHDFPETITFLESDPWDNSIAYAAGNALGLWQSLDYGMTWKTLVMPVDGATITSVALDFHQPANLFMATTAGLYKSSDRGNTWESTGRGLPITTRKIINIEWDSAIPDQGYLTLANNYFGSDALVGKTIDDGASWFFLGNGPVANGEITGFIKDNDSIFAISSSSLYRSIDGGIAWEKIQLPDLGQDNGIIWLQTIPATHDLYVKTNGGLLSSKDNGLSWSVLMRLANPKIASISANRLYYAGSNQGILFSDDGGTSWTSRND